MKFISFLFLGLLISSCSSDTRVISTETEIFLERIKSSLGHGKLWEHISPKGDMVLPDVFYADEIQNLQAMPLQLKLKKENQAQYFHYQIDNLIYPTIGNPILLTKNDPGDYLMVILRIPSDVIYSARPRRTHFSNHYKIDQLNSPPKIYLFPKGKRHLLESGTPLHQQYNSQSLTPDLIIEKNQVGAPTKLSRRKTLALYFKRYQVEGLKSGLYDLRLEWKFGSLVQDQILEWQYNSVQIFKDPPKKGDYYFINFADTQISLDNFLNFRSDSYDQFKNFVQFLKKIFELPKNQVPPHYENLRKAKFITFNGDFHNSGSPTGLSSKWVSKIPNSEAKEAFLLLRELPLPIFLTLGNHDGHTNMGHRALLGNQGKLPNLKSWKRWIQLNNNLVAPKKRYYNGKKGILFSENLKRTLRNLGGNPVNLYSGVFQRGEEESIRNWKEVPENERNYPLYDFTNQWRKTYGPTYMGWSYGDNYFLNLNTFDLRQHHRAGWGMFLVNYGGGVSPFQLGWAKREIKRVTNTNKDIVLVGHHDPRGGHRGKDQPYYFPLQHYRGIPSSVYRFGQDEILGRYGCRFLPRKFLNLFNVSCAHSGLLEWMFPDPEFDCREKNAPCPSDFFSWAQERPIKDIYFSGLELINLLSQSKKIRTVLLGHTHYTSLRTYFPGASLVWQRSLIDDPKLIEQVRDRIKNKKKIFPFYESQGKIYLNLEGFLKNYQTRLENKEIVFLKTTSLGKFTGQKAQASSPNAYPNAGFSLLRVSKKSDSRKYSEAQVNDIQFFINKTGPQGLTYSHSLNYGIKRVPDSRENPNTFDPFFGIDSDSHPYKNPIQLKDGEIYYDAKE